MPAFICTACGTQFPPSDKAPAHCRICEEERQYVPAAGQSWTTLETLAQGYINELCDYEAGITGIGAGFAIGQRALLLQTAGGNVLWDCVATLNDLTIDAVKAQGGLKAIAISHPHFYTAMVEWAKTFGCPIHLHAADKEWIVRPDPAIQLWDGETRQLWDGVTLIRCGGHFEGGTVLHWQDEKQPSGVVCSGDILTVTTDRKWLSFMRSYPNFIPLSGREVGRIDEAMAPFAFDKIYGHYFDRVIATDAKRVFENSVRRYIAAINGTRGY